MYSNKCKHGRLCCVCVGTQTNECASEWASKQFQWNINLLLDPKCWLLLMSKWIMLQTQGLKSRDKLDTCTQNTTQRNANTIVDRIILKCLLVLYVCVYIHIVLLRCYYQTVYSCLFIYCWSKNIFGSNCSVGVVVQLLFPLVKSNHLKYWWLLFYIKAYLYMCTVQPTNFTESRIVGVAFNMIKIIMAKSIANYIIDRLVSWVSISIKYN